jgi:hypothetical protein
MGHPNVEAQLHHRKRMSLSSITGPKACWCCLSGIKNDTSMLIISDVFNEVIDHL